MPRKTFMLILARVSGIVKKKTVFSFKYAILFCFLPVIAAVFGLFAFCFSVFSGARKKIRKNPKKMLTNKKPYVIITKPLNERSVILGSIAQLGEHLPYKQGVIGSSPIVPTTCL